MSDIPNTEYITINKDGIFVGGEPATHYRGEEIVRADGVRENFALIQQDRPDVAELHVLSSETYCEFAGLVGVPSGNHGPNLWYRVKLNDGYVADWVFKGSYRSADSCARYCANHGSYYVWRNSSRIFGYTIKNGKFKPVREPKAKSKKMELKKLEQVDFSKLPKKPIELNGYRILVEKIGPKTK